MTASPNQPELPLAGTRVIELTSNIAAPFGAAVLADLGAEVVHIEGPNGDDSRRMAPTVDDVSAYFLVVNRNKQFQTIDIRTSEGQEVLLGLIAETDVFLTNLRPSKLVKYGLDAAVLRWRFPRLIHAALSAYGHLGEERDRPGYDAVVQARTGIAAVTGTSDGPPVRAGVSVLDVGSGMWLALGVLAALLRRRETGEGADVTTSLYETGAAWVSYHVAAHEVSGARSERHGSGHPAFSPYGIFDAGDGQLCIGIGGDSLYARLCQALDAPHLLSDSRFVSNPERVRNADALKVELELVLKGLTVGDAVSRLTEAGVAADLVQLPEQLLDDPQANTLGLFRSSAVPGRDDVRFPALPLSIDGVRPSGSTARR